jgi:small subunit ribosomal protein S21e
LITAKDHASVQFNIGKVNEKGVYTGEFETFALCGYIRSMGEADGAVNRLAREKGFLKRV